MGKQFYFNFLLWFIFHHHKWTKEEEIILYLRKNGHLDQVDSNKEIVLHWLSK